MEKGMSQLELATQADITPGMVVDLEYGRANPKMKTLNKIAGVLDVPFYALFDEANSQYPYLGVIRQRGIPALRLAVPMLKVSQLCWTMRRCGFPPPGCSSRRIPMCLRGKSRAI